MGKGLLKIAAAGLAIVVAGGAISAYRDHHKGEPKTTKIATQIGATYCNDTGYYVQNRLDDSKSTIYACSVNGDVKCVTEHGGIVDDATAEVRLLFSNTLSGGKPSCI